nr:helix-turn-helix transcriptional regulator [Devosia naphthalenivorans]
MDVLDPSFPVLVRTARAILGWSQAALAERSKVSETSISRLERLDGPGRPSNMKKIVAAFEKAGVRFQSDAKGFGLLVEEPSASAIRADVRKHQLAEKGDEAAAPSTPVPQSRVRRRRVNLDF